MPELPLLALTMGDPSGVGPEIVVKSLAADAHLFCRPLVIGDAGVMARSARMTGAALEVHAVSDPAQGAYRPGVMDVLDLRDVDLDALRDGQVQAASGQAAYEAVAKAIELAMSGAVDGTVTAPLNKEALHLAGCPYAGHTEIYAALTHTTAYAMMLVCEAFRVVHVSTHVSLAEACARVTRERVLETIRLGCEACVALGVEHPRVGVAGLNPHAGENGLFGREELDAIAPAIADARALGIDATGPLPPDTLFSKAYGGWYDIAVAMYHDQGHIPMKMVGFVWDKAAKRWRSVSGVNITLGLPIIRSSVDHGTAFEIAGQNVASADSMRNAVEYAAQMAWHRK